MKFAVIGLGYFGSALARELAESVHEVLAIDTDEDHLREVRDFVAAQADATDEVALSQLGVDGVDTAVVAIGEGFEASLMITAHCQKLGVRRVYTRVINEVHDHLLGLMQVTGKVRAESLAAAYFSRQLTHEAVRRYFGIDAGRAIVELEMPDRYVGKTLAEADLRRTKGINVVTVRRSEAKAGSPGEDPSFEVIGTPDPSFRLEKGDWLIVFARLADIERFCESKDRLGACENSVARLKGFLHRLCRKIAPTRFGSPSPIDPARSADWWRKGWRARSLRQDTPIRIT